MYIRADVAALIAHIAQKPPHGAFYIGIMPHIVGINNLFVVQNDRLNGCRANVNSHSQHILPPQIQNISICKKNKTYLILYLLYNFFFVKSRCKIYKGKKFVKICKKRLSAADGQPEFLPKPTFSIMCERHLTKASAFSIQRPS